MQIESNAGQFPANAPELDASRKRRREILLYFEKIMEFFEAEYDLGVRTLDADVNTSDGSIELRFSIFEDGRCGFRWRFEKALPDTKSSARPRNLRFLRAENFSSDSNGYAIFLLADCSVTEVKDELTKLWIAEDRLNKAEIPFEG